MTKEGSESLRWHVRMRLDGGGVDSYLRVRGQTIYLAIARAYELIAKRHPQHFADEFYITYIALHEDDYEKQERML